MDELLLTRDGPVAVVSLNRPQARNSLSRSLMERIVSVFGDLADDPQVRAIVLTGEGGQAFCAGLDLRELSEDASVLKPEAANPARAVSSCPKPVIGAINGAAITGGFELALACDILIASTAARFADTHGRVGVLPGWGLSQRLPRLIGSSRAKEISFSGNFVGAEQALAWGLVNHVVAPEELRPRAIKLAHDIGQVPADVLHGYKRLIDDGFELPFGAAMALEAERSAAHNRTVKPSDVAARRAEVQARGRRDTGKG